MFHRKRHHQQHCLFSNSCWLNHLWVNLLTGMLSLWIVCGAPESLYKSESPSRTQRLNVYFFMYDWWIKVMHVYMCVVCTYAFHTMGKEELIQMDTHCRSMNRTVRNINASKHTCIQEKMIFAIWNAWQVYNWFFSFFLVLLKHKSTHKRKRGLISSIHHILHIRCDCCCCCWYCSLFARTFIPKYVAPTKAHTVSHMKQLFCFFYCCCYCCCWLFFLHLLLFLNSKAIYIYMFVFPTRSQMCV